MRDALEAQAPRVNGRLASKNMRNNWKMKIGKIKFSIYTFQFAISNITGDALEAQAPRVNGRLACASGA